MKKESDLGTEKIGKLLFKFSLPCVISMLVASLYNIVDQIYIGHIAGFDEVANQAISVLGNGATNVVYPFTLIALAICLLLGDGAAALFSLSEGQKDEKKANKAIGNGLILQIIALIIITVIGFLFMGQILNLFGATNGNLPYAEAYFKIILIGFPFYMFAQGLNSSIRADGSPKYAMFATTIGAILNIILDPVFIFGFNMGIEGAAIATVIGEVVTAIITIIYLFKSKNFKLSKESLKLDFKITKRICALGISSLITQISIVIIIAVSNNLVNKINDPIYGVDIPLAVIGITMKVFGIVVSTCIGIALGGQPIVGYNYGAMKVDRVIETYKKILISCGLIGLGATIIFQFFPNLIINLFGRGNSHVYIEFANYCLKIFLGTIFFTCLIKATSIFLQSAGSSLKSTICSVARDVLFFVPVILIIGLKTMSVKDMLYSAIITDILSFILASILVYFEIKKMRSFAENREVDTVKEMTKQKINESIKVLAKPIVITISREYGSGGRYVGKLLAQKLGINFYDKELIELVAQESGLSEKYIKKTDQTKKNSNYVSNNDDRIFIAEQKVIEKLAKNESCVIIGRCADYILKDKKDVMKIYLYSDDKSKVKRATKYYGLSKENALKLINKINKDRARHYKYYTDREWVNPTNYDVMINVDKVGVEKTADNIKDMILKERS